LTLIYNGIIIYCFKYYYIFSDTKIYEYSLYRIINNPDPPAPPDIEVPFPGAPAEPVFAEASLGPGIIVPAP
jgi:hypothetical protein